MAERDKDDFEETPGKTSPGGESGGGAYVNRAAGNEDGEGEGGFMGHGGQSHESYSGPGDKDDPGEGGDNAVSRD